MRNSDPDFLERLAGSGLMTAEILYRMPDHPGLLQTFTWQTLDEAPSFPRLARFLDHWRREIRAVIHTIRVAHSELLAPAELQPVNGEFRLN